MTGRTHDLAAFAALSYAVATVPPEHVSVATAIVALCANFIGGLTPDIDQPTADLWHRLPLGGAVSRLFTPFLGGHRYISHSLLGVIVFGLGSKMLLNAIGAVLLVDMQLVWYAFMIGFISHLIMDTFTTEGVPWLFPLPLHFGFPPLRILRLKTGGMMEKSVVFPLLLVVTVALYVVYKDTFLLFFHQVIK